MSSLEIKDKTFLKAIKVVRKIIKDLLYHILLTTPKKIIDDVNVIKQQQTNKSEENKPPKPDKTNHDPNKLTFSDSENAIFDKDS